MSVRELLSVGAGADPRCLSVADQRPAVSGQLLSALPGALRGIPLGIGLFAAANGARLVTVPPAAWLSGVVLATLAVVEGLTAIRPGLGGRRPAVEVLQAERS
jgi:hypothetical protein